MKTTSIVLALASALPALAVSEITYNYDTQAIAAHIETDFGVHNHIESISASHTGQSLAYNYAFSDSDQQVTAAGSLVTTLSLDSITATASSSSSAFPLIWGAVNPHFAIQFNVSETVAYEVSGTMQNTTDQSFARITRVSDGSTVFAFYGSTGGVEEPFSAAGILAFNETYLMEFSASSYTGGSSAQTMNFGLTSSPVPEPETYASIAGLALVGFALWRRRKS